MKPPDNKQLHNGRPGGGGGVTYPGQINKNDVHFNNATSKVPPPPTLNGRGFMDKPPPQLSTSPLIPNGRMQRPNSKIPRLPIEVSGCFFLNYIYHDLKKNKFTFQKKVFCVKKLFLLMLEDNENV